MVDIKLFPDHNLDRPLWMTQNILCVQVGRPKENDCENEDMMTKI